MEGCMLDPVHMLGGFIPLIEAIVILFSLFLFSLKSR